jgi:hypothetical protein
MSATHHFRRYAVLLSIALLIAIGCNMPGIVPQAVDLFPTETEIPYQALLQALTPDIGSTQPEAQSGRKFVQPASTEPLLVPQTGLSPTPPPTVTAAAGQVRCRVPAVTAAPGQTIVFVYFHCDDQLTSAPRLVPQGNRDELAYTAMQALLVGPTAAEQAAGYTSWFSVQTAGSLRALNSASGQVVVDMADFSAIIPNASSSAGSRMLVDQISATLFQFADYQSILLTFDGDCNRFWNWIQMDCSEILRSP